MRLGIPDDYAEAFLADILTRFNRRHPVVEVSVVCENSVELAAQVHAGALDLAVVTDDEGVQGFELIREEPLVWVASRRFKLPEGAPVPLAMGSPTCIWRRVAEEALRGRRTRRAACSSPRTTPRSAGRARRPRRDGAAAAWSATTCACSAPRRACRACRSPAWA